MQYLNQGKLKRCIASVLAATLVISAFSFSVSAKTGKVEYPLKSSAKITYWVPLNSNVSGTSKSLNETLFAKGLAERTGIEVEFIHPAISQEAEQFNLMISSGKMADIVEFNWLTQYPSGMEAAIKNGLAYKLNDKMTELAPDFTAYMNDNPEIAKMAKTDEGSFYGFPFIRGDDSLMVFHGPIVRQDWLDELKLDLPETIDEWTTVLKAFRDKKGATSALSGEALAINPLNMFDFGAFIGAYGIKNGFYRDGDEIKHGAIEPGFKEWLIQMNEWYKEGLFNKDFATDLRAELDAKLTKGEAGATVGYTGSGIGTWISAFKEVDPDAILIGTKYPVLNKGDTPAFGQKDFPIIASAIIAVVNPKSGSLEAAVNFLNYGYTEEGNMYYNFGTVGRDYEIISGYPTMSDSVLKPETGSIGTAWAQVARANYNGPFVQRPEYYAQYVTYPTQLASVLSWSQTTGELTNLPPISVSEDESKDFSKIKANIDAYIGEWAPMAIMGTADISKFETEFVKTLKDLGIEDAVRIQQAAYDRYMLR